MVDIIISGPRLRAWHDDQKVGWLRDRGIVLDKDLITNATCLALTDDHEWAIEETDHAKPFWLAPNMADTDYGVYCSTIEEALAKWEEVRDLPTRQWPTETNRPIRREL